MSGDVPVGTQGQPEREVVLPRVDGVEHRHVGAVHGGRDHRRPAHRQDDVDRHPQCAPVRADAGARRVGRRRRRPRRSSQDDDHHPEPASRSRRWRWPCSTSPATSRSSAIYALTFVLGVISALDNPARRGFVTELVPEEQITNAVSLNTAVMTGSRIFGPAITATLVDDHAARRCCSRSTPCRSSRSSSRSC